MTWGVASAKAKFSSVLDLAEAEGPQQVQRRRQRFLVVTEEQWAERAKVATAAADEPSATAEENLWDLLRLPEEFRSDEDLFPRTRGEGKWVKF